MSTVRSTHCVFVAAALVVAAAAPAGAQVLGPFPWQMQPYCNTVTIRLTGSPTGFTLDGVDNQCGATDQGSVTGTASFNASGNVTLNFTIVTAPGGVPVSVSAVVNPANGDGTWTDSNGFSGTFKFFGATGGLPSRPDPGGVRFRATDTNDINVNGTSVNVTWATLSYNLGGGTYTPANGTFTVPVAGTYLINGAVRFEAQAAPSGYYCMGIAIANALQHYECAAQSGALFVIPNVVSTMQLNAGDVVSIRVLNSGGAQVVSGVSTTSEFSVTRLK